MAKASSIEWTDATWNPITGCTKVSKGCKDCYAERMAFRLRAMGVKRYENGFNLKLHEDMLRIPLGWSKSKLIFVNSMSDLFHENVPFEFIRRVFDTMEMADWHIFQILTKRAKRLHQISHDLPWSEHIWVGVSVESAEERDRIRHLSEVPAQVRFLSCEPLLGPLERLPLAGIHWVIVGGESGPKARPMDAAWVDSIRLQCEEAAVPFFFKQWGGVRKRATGRKLNGKTYDGFPLTGLKLLAARDAHRLSDAYA